MEVAFSRSSPGLPMSTPTSFLKGDRVLELSTLVFLGEGVETYEVFPISEFIREGSTLLSTCGRREEAYEVPPSSVPGWPGDASCSSAIPPETTAVSLPGLEFSSSGMSLRRAFSSSGEMTSRCHLGLAGGCPQCRPPFGG